MLTNIELSVPEGKRILSGKEVGIKARNEHSLDDLDQQDGYISVCITAPVVTSSFILGMFSKSMQHFGVEKFFDKYRFDAKDDIIRNLEINARYSTTEGTALD